MERGRGEVGREVGAGWDRRVVGRQQYKSWGREKWGGRKKKIDLTFQQDPIYDFKRHRSRRMGRTAFLFKVMHWVPGLSINQSIKQALVWWNYGWALDQCVLESMWLTWPVLRCIGPGWTPVPKCRHCLWRLKGGLSPLQGPGSRRCTDGCIHTPGYTRILQIRDDKYCKLLIFLLFWLINLIL